MDLNLIMDVEAWEESKLMKSWWKTAESLDELL
jgi:hypothetical protein